MTSETWTIIGTGVALATLIIGSTRSTWRAIDVLDKRIDTIAHNRDRLEDGLAELRERMAKLEGLLEGLREAIGGRRTT